MAFKLKNLLGGNALDAPTKRGRPPKAKNKKLTSKQEVEKSDLKSKDNIKKTRKAATKKEIKSNTKTLNKKTVKPKTDKTTKSKIEEKLQIESKTKQKSNISNVTNSTEWYRTTDRQPEELRPLIFNTTHKKPVVGYKLKYGYITNTPYFIDKFKKKHGYIEWKYIDGCMNLFKCPAKFPDCSVCKLSKQKAGK